MSALPSAELAAYLAAVRALVDTLNASAASGLITRQALVLLGSVDQRTRTLERRVARERDGEQAP
jgi:hypothetical protein